MAKAGPLVISMPAVLEHLPRLFDRALLHGLLFSASPLPPWLDYTSHNFVGLGIIYFC